MTKKQLVRTLGLAQILMLGIGGTMGVSGAFVALAAISGDVAFRPVSWVWRRLGAAWA